MPTPLFLFLIALLGLTCLGLGWRLGRESRARTAARLGYFDAVLPLFDEVRTQRQPAGFARVAGRRDGLDYDLQAVPDSLTFRKLPALWVMLTLTEAMPLTATLDLMARPSGAEPFSRFATLPQALPTPEGLPPGLAIRTDDAAACPPEALIHRHAALFGDARVKELILSPRGLRIVLLAEEADRSRYLLFREAEMGRSPLPAARLAPLIERLVALRRDLMALAGAPA